MKSLILLPGMNGKTSLYARLRPRFPELLTPEWIEPLVNEPLVHYAARLAEVLRPQLTEPCVLGGTSFGGMVAQELAPVLGLESCLLISTVRSPAELPQNWHALRPLALAGEEAFLGQPRFKNRFLCWAAWAVLTWEQSPAAARLTTWHLHGDRDTTFPLAQVHPDEIVVGGGHVLPMTHTDAVEAFIRQKTERASPTLAGPLRESSR